MFAALAARGKGDFSDLEALWLYSYGPLPSYTNLSANSKISDGEKFKRTERILDRQQFGPLWLKNALIAQLVVESIIYSTTFCILTLLCQIMFTCLSLLGSLFEKLLAESRGPLHAERTRFSVDAGNPSGRTNRSITGFAMQGNFGDSSVMLREIR
jgi:hypothetical protein